MSKSNNFVRSNGLIKLPPGFRFQPTEEELVFQYLRCKVFSCPLPASIIPEINLCKYDPWDLPAGDSEEEKYFFSNKEAKYRNGTRTNRRTSSGYWKATGSDKKIVSSTKKDIFGMRKTFVFYNGKPTHGTRTDWIMHEYSLFNAETNNFPQIDLNQTENWVLCRIFMRERSTKNEEIVMGTVYSSSSSCSSSSSDTTEVSSRETVYEESSGCTKYFGYY
ncbi:hypothetical protein UlMin_007616 [Ulmus minor]